MPENPRVEELRRRVQADPASIAFAALAEEFRRIGRFEDAIETCRTGLQRHPAYLSARVTLGRALIEMGEYDAAREELQTVLRSAPENLAAIRGLAQIDERLGHSSEMHADLHEMMREPIRLAAQPPPAPSFAPSSQHASEGRPAEPPPAPAPAADALSAFTFQPAEPPAAQPAATLDLSLNPSESAAPEPEAGPVDIFAAALAPKAGEPPPPPPLAFETATIAFESPSFAPPSHTASEARPSFAPPSHTASEGRPEAGVNAPDPLVAAAVLRLERFLGAIQSARHA